MGLTKTLLVFLVGESINLWPELANIPESGCRRELSAHHPTLGRS